MVFPLTFRWVETIDGESCFRGGGLKYFLCLPLLGEMIQSDEHMFQRGGSTTNQF